MMGQFLGPETDGMCQFLGPETDIMGERYYIKVTQAQHRVSEVYSQRACLKVVNLIIQAVADCFHKSL